MEEVNHVAHWQEADQHPGRGDRDRRGRDLDREGPEGRTAAALPAGLDYGLEDGELSISRPDDSKPMKARHGLVRALIANQVTGVTTGFKKSLEIIGVGYRAAVKGQALDLQLQFSHPVEYPIPGRHQDRLPRPDAHRGLGHGQAAGGPGRRGDPRLP